MKKDYFKILLKYAKIANKKYEIPVSALIVKDNNIITISYNNRCTKLNPIGHAEINCIIKATKKLKTWHLDDCDMYVTLEPCHMCKEIIKEVRIKNLYYYVQSTKKVSYKTNFKKINYINTDQYNNLLTNFFKKLR